MISDMIIQTRFDRFSDKDLGREMTDEECRAIMLDMMRELLAFSKEHGLRCYLSGGTLLGAVRHQGFIPWDDDIDINMPRPDAEKLLSLTGGRLGKYIVSPPYRYRFAPMCNIIRIYDPSSILVSMGGGYARHPEYMPLFVDIFPIEGMPSNPLMRKLHIAASIALKKLQRAAFLTRMEGRSKAAHLFHIAVWPLAKAVGYKRWSELMQALVTHYDFESADYVGVMTAPAHDFDEVMVKADYLPVTPVTFEGEQASAPLCYDTYLTQLYGDYMKMPPLEKQKTHHAFHVYRRRGK